MTAEEAVKLSERHKDMLCIVVESFDGYFVDKIPRILQALIAAIEERGVETEGIYRLSGNFLAVKALCEQCFEDDTLNFSESDVHELTGAIKFILRDMNPPLLTFDLYDRFLESVSSDEDSEHPDAIAPVLQDLPDKNFRELYLLIQHLRRFADLSFLVKFYRN